LLGPESSYFARSMERDRGRERGSADEMEVEMTTPAKSHIPDGYHTVTPFVIVKGAAGFIDYMVRAFGGVELGRVGEEGAIGHAEVRIGDSVVMCFDSKPGWPDTPAFLRLYVEDADSTHRKAVEAGGTSVTDPIDQLWGDRGGRVRDPFGNLWWIMTRVEDVDPDELERRWSDPEWLERLAVAENAEFFPKT
jgi:PhnB protein